MLYDLFGYGLGVGGLWGEGVMSTKIYQGYIIWLR